ncbi:MAG: hypothetical protein ACRCXA_08875 [Peptostreptococcaceae bacterium]
MPEEIKEIHEKLDDDINENIKCRFAKITTSNGNKIDVEYVSTPDII